VVAAAAFNLPILTWARNAWDISSPTKLLVLGGILTAIGCGAIWLLTFLKVDIKAASLGVAAGLIVFVHWARFDDLALIIWITAVIATTLVGHLLAGTRLIDGAIVVLIAVLGVAPLAQLAIAHLANSTPYPLVPLAESDPDVTPTGAVEDVIFIVVDGYPSLRIAQDWFGRDTSPLVDKLSSRGFEVLPEAWSQGTFTAPSVSALLELQPVIEAGQPEPWGNLAGFYAITRGDSFVSRTLRSAGFTYTHFESGWDVTSCGDGVDRCVESLWIDETVEALIASSGLGNWVERRLGNYVVEATLHTTAGLLGEGRVLVENGSHDYIFAHLSLPHDPPVVNEQCRFEEERVIDNELFHKGQMQIEDRRRAIADQMACVDLLLADIAELVGPSTAILVTGDHGTGTGGQIPHAPSEWTDSDVAERFGVLLAYHLPMGCDRPSDAINTLVMRALILCAVDLDLPAEKLGHLIGLAAPEWVDPDRMTDIRRRLSRGSIEPDPDDR
jgi:hypothetical protein